MKAVFFTEFGASDVLRVGERPRPAPRPGEVSIEVHAASVNPRDWLIRSGRYQARFLLPRLPLILGSDVSGVVAEVGRRVSRWRPGDEVYAMQPSSRGLGCYAEVVAVPQSAVAAKPAVMSHEEAAGVPLAALTARQALLDLARLAAGERLLIIGGSGGVGSYAVQIAKARGAHVTAVCSTANVELVESLGADEVIDYKRQSFLEPPPARYRAVFDTIGRESLASCAPVLARGGVYVTTIPNGRTLVASAVSRLRALVSRRRPTSRVVMVRASGEQLRQLGGLAEAGELRTHVDTVYPLERAAEAHDHSRTFRTRGKLILKVR